MEVRAGGFTGIAYKSDYFAPVDRLPCFRRNTMHVSIKCNIPEPVINFHAIAVTLLPTCTQHTPVAGSINIGARGCRKVHPGVKSA